MLPTTVVRSPIRTARAPTGVPRLPRVHRDFTDLLARTTEEVLEDGAAAGGDDAHHSGPENRSVHAQLRSRHGRRDRCHGTPRHLRHVQIYTPFLGLYVSFRLLHHSQPLIDISPTMQQEGTIGRSKWFHFRRFCEAGHASWAYHSQVGIRTPVPDENFGGAPVHPHGPNGVLWRALGPDSHVVSGIFGRGPKEALDPAAPRHRTEASYAG